jgi:hypothetical protein
MTLATALAVVSSLALQGVERAPRVTNYVTRSGSVCKAGNTAETGWNLLTATCANDAAMDPAGGTSADAVTNSSNTGIIYASPGSIPSTRTLLASVWAAKASGTGAFTIGIRCGAAPSACACWRSDGGACTATVGGTDATDCTVKVLDLGTSWVRLFAKATCPAAVTSSILSLVPGNNAVAVGTTRFWGAQVQSTTRPTFYVQTEGAARTVRRMSPGRAIRR